MSSIYLHFCVILIIVLISCADPEIFMRGGPTNMVIFGHRRGGGSNPQKIPKLPFFGVKLSNFRGDRSPPPPPGSAHVSFVVVFCCCLQKRKKRKSRFVSDLVGKPLITGLSRRGLNVKLCSFIIRDCMS